jgi:hypothetical protein
LTEGVLALSGKWKAMFVAALDQVGTTFCDRDDVGAKLLVG